MADPNVNMPSPKIDMDDPTVRNMLHLGPCLAPLVDSPLVEA